MSTILQKVKSTISEHNMLSPNEKVLVGVSGGADSVALAIILKKLGYNVFIAHINHNLRGEESIRDEEFVKGFSKSIGAAFFCLSANVNEVADKNGICVEEAGRNIRYGFFEKVAKDKKISKIAVAHNQNDSAETVLINLIRGAALGGQRGILPVNKNVIRPLINVSREEIESFLFENNISHVTDSTNLENFYLRNVIRNKIILELKKYNKNIIETITKNAKIINDENDFLDEIVKSEAKTRIKKEDNVVTLNIDDHKLHISIKRRLVLKAIKILRGNTLGISQKHVEEILSLNRSGARFNLPKRLTVSFNYGILTFIINNFDSKNFCYNITNLEEIFIPEISKKFIIKTLDKPDEPFSKHACYLNIDNLNESIYMRSRLQKDKFIPSGMTSHKKLQDFFVDNKIPEYKRNRIPIISCDSKIMAVFGHRVSNEFLVDKNTKKILKIALAKQEEN